MIVVDSSALVGIINEEEGSERLLAILDAEECAIGAPTLVEARAWCVARLQGGSSKWLEDAIAGDSFSIVPFGHEMADIASAAFLKFGRRSGHSANLNFGDCMAYAVSAALRAPLLFKGNDFGWTDVMIHPASVRT